MHEISVCGVINELKFGLLIYICQSNQYVTFMEDFLANLISVAQAISLFIT